MNAGDLGCEGKDENIGMGWKGWGRMEEWKIQDGRGMSTDRNQRRNNFFRNLGSPAFVLFL